jgi:dihydroorotase-like cyclic amidohydrolase
VLVTDGVIERVGDAQDAVPDGARVVDLEGRMLSPGLINLRMHTQPASIDPEHGAEPILPGTMAHFLSGTRRLLQPG